MVELRQIWSYAPIRSMERTVKSSCLSVTVLITWPTQSVPALVDKANWKGAQVSSTWSINCLARVFATTRPPSRFCNVGFQARKTSRPLESPSTAPEAFFPEVHSMWSDLWVPTLHRQVLGAPLTLDPDALVPELPYHDVHTHLDVVWPLCEPTRFCLRIRCLEVCATSSSAPRQTTSNLAPHLPSTLQDIFPAELPGNSLATALARNEDSSSTWELNGRRDRRPGIDPTGPLKIPC